MKTSRVSAIVRSFRQPEALLRSREHGLEVRTLPDRVQVVVGLEMADEGAAVYAFKIWLQHLERRIRIIEVLHQRTGEIIAHRQVAGIECKRALHPFPRAVLFAEKTEQVRTSRQRVAVGRVLADRPFGAVERNLRSLERSVLLADAPVAADCHHW